MFKLITAVALAIGVAATPVAAVTTYDAFTSFDATQGAGNFTYGSFSAVNSSFTPFGAGSAGCTGLISQTICLGALPGAFKTTAGAHNSGSVIVPDDRLVLHPGSGDDAAYIEFTASVAGFYALLGGFSAQDTSPSGVDISFFLRSGGVLQFITPVGSLSAGNLDIPYFNGGPLSVGESVGFIIDKQGAYFNDSTGVTMTLLNLGVPEPTSWMLLIGGFGLTGAALRRRRSTALTA